jgi:hypothetical protein
MACFRKRTRKHALPSVEARSFKGALSSVRHRKDMFYFRRLNVL